MIKIYHGSLEVVRRPEIRVPSHSLDYGAGFYCTTSGQQAREWVVRRMNAGRSFGFVNVYELDERKLDALKTLVFDTPTDGWVDFVMRNRTDPGFTHDYDVVYGPVANDRVYAQFALYEAQLIGKETLISELKTYRLVDQYLFHTERSLEAICFVESVKVVDLVAGE